MLIGISIYNRYMSTWKYRTIFIATQLLMVGAGMLDYAFVKRWNLSIGISDKAFVIGDEVSQSVAHGKKNTQTESTGNVFWWLCSVLSSFIQALIPLLRKFSTIPFFVLASKVCPEKCEATLFALLMALSNFGGDVGRYVSVCLGTGLQVSN